MSLKTSPARYRIKNSIIEGHPAIKAAFAARGIVDYCNAILPGHRTRCTQVFKLASGEIVLADSRTVRSVAIEASGEAVAA